MVDLFLLEESLSSITHLKTNNLGTLITFQRNFFIETPQVEGEWVYSPALVKLFSSTDINPNLLRKETGSISVAFYRLLVLNTIFTKEAYGDVDLKHAIALVEEMRHKSLFSSIAGHATLIVYLVRFKQAKWENLSMSHIATEWPMIHALSLAAVYVDLKVTPFLSWLHLVVRTHSTIGGLFRIGERIKRKIKNDPIFKDHTKDKLGEIRATPDLQRFLPAFLGAIVDEDFMLYQHYLHEWTEGGHPVDYQALYALAVSCPAKQEASDSLFKVVTQKWREAVISDAEYIQLHQVKGTVTSELVLILKEKAAISPEQETLVAIAGYLSLTTENGAPWYKDVLSQLVHRGGAPLKSVLKEIFFDLSKSDRLLAYELLTTRFSVLGHKDFLENFYSTLAVEEPHLFREQLVDWFNKGNESTHLAMRKLTSLRELDASIFRFDHERLRALSRSEMLYVAYKVAGNIYSKEPLINLIISLTNSLKKHDFELESYLAELYSEYIIYNYRSTLDTIKEQLNLDIPEHLKVFYQRLIVAYQRYFDAISRIPDVPELQPNAQIVQFIQFYKQQQFSALAKKERPGTIANLFKATILNSNRMAVRRPGEPKHQVSDLAHFQVTMEYPSGEKLNPVAQEKRRKFYQRLKKDEIALN